MLHSAGCVILCRNFNRRLPHFYVRVVQLQGKHTVRDDWERSLGAEGLSGLEGKGLQWML